MSLRSDPKLRHHGRIMPSAAVIAPKIAPTPAPKNKVGLRRAAGSLETWPCGVGRLLHLDQSSGTSLIASSTLRISCGASYASGPWTSRRLSIVRS
jgi:hypothetical protein